MKNRLIVARAATLTLLTAGVFSPALGEEAAPAAPQVNGFEFCSTGSGSSGCVKFQGYIYVGRPPAGGVAPVNNPGLGEERLYIHVDGADAR